MQSATRTKLILYLGSLKPVRDCKFHPKAIFEAMLQNSRKTRVKTKVSSVSQTSQVPSKKRHKPSRKKIRNTTDDKDLWVLKERIQSNVKGKDFSLWFMRHEARISLRRVSCIYSHLHYMVKAISCHLAAHLNESKFNGNYWKDRKRVAICTWLRFMFDVNRFSYCAQVIYRYREYNRLFFEPLLHISVKILFKMRKVWHLR